MKTKSGILQQRAFTLIELLVVVVIIAILAALAVPSLLNAQARAKVSRVRADMRTIQGSLAAYRVDERMYPPAAIDDAMLEHPLRALTTPVSYMSSIPVDPFGAAPLDFLPDVKLLGYQYCDAVTTSVGIPGETYGAIWRENPRLQYMLHSCGPNRVWDVTPYVDYDPTNGVVSRGDICAFGSI
ncbi:MAG: prepilin-type N-terminal cleavage/methylation domain-containing protein [Candidatus Sumerlaeota bacterium]